MITPPLCKDCRHYNEGGCKRLDWIDYEDGEIAHNDTLSAWQARVEHCGIQAAIGFEPKAICGEPEQCGDGEE